MFFSCHVGYICSLRVVQLIKPNASEQNTMGMSIKNLLEPLKGYPIVKSSPKISRNIPATTSPNIHKALGIKAISSSSDATFYLGFNVYTSSSQTIGNNRPLALLGGFRPMPAFGYRLLVSSIIRLTFLHHYRLGIRPARRQNGIGARTYGRGSFGRGNRRMDNDYRFGKPDK
ncbi:MAG: hypothetical protein ABSA77_11665, partial [Thermoguttaceae bacterium]